MSTDSKRKQVYAKFDGRCAYCGSEITMGEMQMDHIVAKSTGGRSCLENLNPACPMCNTRKRNYSIKRFRKELSANLDTPQAQLLLAYGLIQKTDKEVTFYFETRKPN